MSQLKKGALLNYITIFLTNVVGLLLTPFILKYLGKNEYGIFITIGALIGTISILDFGLNNTIIRFVAKYRAEKDKEGEENFLATTMIIYMIISLLVLIVGFSFYANIESYFTKLNPEEIEIAKVMFVILIFNLAIRLPGGSFTGICSGYEEFVFPKTLNIIRYVLRSLTVVAVLLYGGRSIALVIVDTVFNVSVIIVTGYFVFRKLKVKFKLHSLKKSFIKHILKYSVWIFVFSLVGLFQWKAGHWVLGRISPPAVLTIYGIGITLGTYYGAFSTAISGVFLPRATQMSVDNASGEQLTDMMIKIGRLSFIVLMYILIAFALYGNQFVNLWVGDTIGEEGSYQSWVIALMIMMAYTLPLVQHFGNSILEAKNKLSFKAILYLSFMIIGTVIGAVFAKKYAAIGMMAGSVIGWLIVQNVMNFYYHKVIKLNIPRFFKELAYKTILALIIILAVGYFINYIPGEGWLNFVLKGSTFTIVFGVLMYTLGLHEYEKQLFVKPIASVLRRK
ncbi:lipopolysaccharide biosynthesis protein [Aquimarina sp. AU474]|uniref:lipopolysaccharide biosynthesis protein n=1 Tax=Aquimarina sp. AU474 TaxID=2108529 RepID=UPI000D685674|nr:oligosaccharide flippase family protein [Aquimarina sp. AU474]